jgi:uncharacterized protein (DUF433 family)
MITTKKIHIEPKIGEGVYSTQDISLLLDLPYHKVRQAMNGFWQNYTFGDKGDKSVNFLTLIEFYTYYRLREHGIKPSIIKKAHTEIAKHLNTPYPFARDIIHTDGKGIWYDLLELLINADGSQQINIAPIVKPFLNRIQFNDNKLAEKYFPLEGSDKIVVDPKLQFGQPVISGTRIKAEIIHDFYSAGESKELICKLYNLSYEQVDDAITYYKQTA